MLVFFKEKSPRDIALEKAGFLELTQTQRDWILNKFRRGPWTLEERHFKHFIMLVKHVKNNKFKFSKIQ